MRRSFIVFALLVAPAALVVGACAGDDPPPPGPKPLGDASASDAAPVDAGSLPSSVRCTQAELDAAASSNGGDLTSQPAVTISFPTGSTPAQYTNRCVKVKVNTVVTFAGAFSQHPLMANGGDTPTPIPAMTSTDQDGGALAITMTTPGTFGFDCQFHPTIMFGAIQVVP